MNQIAIRASNLSKMYRINVGRGGSDSLAECVVGGVRALWGRVKSSHLPATKWEDIWPLRDATFEIRGGEVVGIVGRNGAGKSTLLKLLSRITEPTSGQAEIHGRVGTLLEVGTGFHPELTGRDNIYLSGVILGMKKAEIDRRFEEIVEFAGIGKFVDTPVKRYSSGMYVRLAFAVGAHLDPEVLIVDEVLAVGDQQFQQKCLDKMQEIGGQGRTVIFVSHNMQAVTRLCQRVLLLDKGYVVADGPAAQVVGTYLHQGAAGGPSREWALGDEGPGDSTARLRALRIRNRAGEISEVVDIREDFTIEMEYEVHRADRALIPNFVVTNQEGLDLFESFELDPRWRRRIRPEGWYLSQARIPGNFLPEGTFFISPACFSLTPHEVQFYERDVVAFQVVDRALGDSARGDYTGEMLGVMRPKLEWETHLISPSLEVPRPPKAA